MRSLVLLPLAAAVLALPLAAQETDMPEVSFEEAGWTMPDAPASGFDGLLVDLVDDLDEDELAELRAETGLALEKTWDVDVGNRLIVRGDAAALEHARRVLDGRDEVESVELNVMMALFDDEMDPPESVEIQKPDRKKPNDPLYKHQWHMNMVDAEAAWARADGSGVIVAVIDTGVSPGKLENGKKSKFKRVPDLKETEFVPGYNFVKNNNDPSDGNGHGTHVAGTIAQSTNNGFGVTGLAPKAKIMPIKVLSDQGWGSMGAIAAGIRFAADNGAHVINMSLGGGGYQKTMAKAIEYARKKGVTVICAAGNGGKQKVEFPAAYPGAFAVSALGPDGKLAFYSSYGKELSIAAPGGDTRVDLNGDGIPDGVLQDTIARKDPNKHGFFPFQGTSMATPHVAGVAALIVSTGVTDPDRVEEILKSSATKMDDAIRFGAGGLNAGAAIKAAQRTSSGLSLGLAALLGFLAVRTLRRRDALSTFKPTFGFVSALTLFSGGLFVLSEVGLGSSFLAAPVLEWPMHLFGAGAHLNALLGSAAVVFVPMMFLFGIKRARPWLAGLGFGVAGFLLGHALLGEINVQWVPGHGVLDFAWLSLNGVLAAALGFVAMKRD